MSDESPRLAAVEKDSEVEIQGVEGSRATLLREQAALPFLAGVPKASSDWSPAPRHQHRPHWGFPNTNLPPQMNQGEPHQLPKVLPHFLQLSEAE